MRKSAETTARSTEPWAMPRSGRRPQTSFASPAERPTEARALPSVEAPAWLPTEVYGIPSRSSTPSVCPYSRAVTNTSSPRASNRSMIGRRTSGCAAAVQSTQTFISRHLLRFASGGGGRRHIGAARENAGLVMLELSVAPSRPHRLTEERQTVAAESWG